MKEYRLFADILDYPAPALVEQVDELILLVAPADDAVGQLLARFRGYITGNAPGRREELYSGTFDLQPLCYPYVGYQLFGEEYRRGMFMARLREQFRCSGFAAGDDLPDHICVILRFLAGREPEEVERELVSECLVPALRKMITGITDAANPYRDLLQALLIVLGGYAGESATP